MSDFITVENQIIHIKFSIFSWGRTNSKKLHIVKMNGVISPHPISAKIKLIALVVVENKCILGSSSIWSSKVGNNSIVFDEQRRWERQARPV